MYQQIASSIVHANHMKHSVDPNDRSIELPSNDVIDEPEEDLLEVSFDRVSRGDWLGNAANFKEICLCYGFDLVTWV